jgi:PAS domain S-box-containing protein
MSKRDDELVKLEKIAESFGTMGNFARVLRDSYSRLENQYEDINSRLAQVNDLLRKSLVERNRLAHYLSNILESLDSAVIVTDQNHIITVFNSTAEKYTQIKAESALGQKLGTIVDLGRSQQEFESLQEGVGVLTGDLWFHSGDGSKLPMAYSITRLRQDNSEDQKGLVIILHNLSELKILEENLRQVSNLAALGEMAATVAHEIRNPLAGIAGFTALLLRDLEKDSPNRRLVEKIDQGVASLDKIVASLLDYTRNISPAITEVDAVSVVKEAITDIQAAEESRAHDINIESTSRVLRANLDPQLFRMVVFNLVKNAMQARPDGSSIRLTLKRSYDSTLNLIVEDDGPGIPDDAFDKLFTPFYTTKADGTGLGLATVKKLIELHGGRVEAQNRPQGGARFVIEIPDQINGVSSEKQGPDRR